MYLVYIIAKFRITIWEIILNIWIILINNDVNYNLFIIQGYFIHNAENIFCDGDCRTDTRRVYRNVWT